MAPFLRQRYHLSLGETGVLISASLAGSVVSLVPWGYATDRFGERLVLLAGVGGCGVSLVGVPLKPATNPDNGRIGRD